jgi:glutathione S-transferase
VDYAQIPALAERGRARVEHFFSLLEGRLGEAEYIAGERFSVADISALVGVDFAAWVKLEIADDQVNLKRWYADISARPACRV